jgi:hypothetical protein
MYYLGYLHGFASAAISRVFGVSLEAGLYISLVASAIVVAAALSVFLP